MKNKVIIFIDVISPKNKLQVSVIQQLNMLPFCFVSQKKEASDKYFENGGQQQQLKDGFFQRLTQVFVFLKRNRSTIHHIEFYPGGRFSFIYLLLGRLFFLKTLCVERGDLLYFNKNGYSLFTRFSMWICYRFSKMVWYRELYMKPILQKIRKQGLFFLHNAIKIEAHTDISETKDIDFLWLNRVIPQRKYKWFLDVLKSEKLSHTNNYLVGLLSTPLFSADQEYVITNKIPNLTLLEYSASPAEYFKRARFFVLPADVVFANHALLEAMSYGVVPLISQQPGSDLIVDDHINGFIFEHTQAAFDKAVYEALQLSPGEYDSYSRKAIKKIKDVFSEQKYGDAIATLYKTLD